MKTFPTLVFTITGAFIIFNNIEIVAGGYEVQGGGACGRFFFCVGTTLIDKRLPAVPDEHDLQKVLGGRVAVDGLDDHDVGSINGPETRNSLIEVKDAEELREQS